MMMSKMDTLTSTELRGLASMHLMRQLLADCTDIYGRARVRGMTWEVWRRCGGGRTEVHSLADKALASDVFSVGEVKTHRRCCPAIVAHWLKASDR